MVAIIVGPAALLELVGFLSIAALFGGLAVRGTIDPSTAFAAELGILVLRLVGQVVNPGMFGFFFRGVIPLASLAYLFLGADGGHAAAVLGPLLLIAIIAFGFYVVLGGLRR